MSKAPLCRMSTYLGESTRSLGRGVHEKMSQPTVWVWSGLLIHPSIQQGKGSGVRGTGYGVWGEDFFLSSGILVCDGSCSQIKARKRRE